MTNVLLLSNILMISFSDESAYKLCMQSNIIDFIYYFVRICNFCIGNKFDHTQCFFKLKKCFYIRKFRNNDKKNIILKKSAKFYFLKI